MPSSSPGPSAPPPGKMIAVEFKNFKSYGGRVVIGPFGDFSAVIGPNGAGKSNLMDGISFVVGLATKDLRGKQLKDLIYRSTSDKGDENRSASVALVYERDGKQITFKRSITPAGVGEYRIDGRTIKAEAYFARLKALGVHTKAHLGFLVFQGYVSELAAKSPMELTTLFEQISGAEELKEEYERLEREKKRAEEDQIYSYQKKKGLTQERTNMRKQKEEAEAYTELLEQRKDLRQRLYLMRLFGVEKEVASLHAQIAEAQSATDASVAKHTELEESVKTNEKEKARLGREVLSLERKAVELQRKVEGKTPDAIRLREEISHAERRKRTSEKSLEKVLEQQAKGEELLAKLESELAEAASSIGRLEEEAEEAGEAGELSMGVRQRAEYQKLKKDSASATAALQEQIGKKKRELKGLEPTLLTLRTRVEEIGGEKEALEAKVQALEERRVGGQEKAKELGSSLKAVQQQIAQLASSSRTSRERRATLEARLAEVVGALRSSRAEHRESEKGRSSKEAIENLMRLFPGVHGRMTDICKPTQRRYHAAVTVAMGKNMDAVVVDTERTAMDCITYLKEKKCAPETFLPLESIRAKPVREALRSLGGTKLPVQDVLSAPERFTKALQFAVGDAVVCDSLTEARQLAYHSSGSERFKVVTVDGTLINKAGLMAGGSSPQEQARASRWSQAEHDKLKGEQEAIRRELEELGTPMAAEEREHSLRHAAASRQQEAATATADLELTKQKIAKHKKELAQLATSLNQARGSLSEAEERQSKTKAELSQLEAEVAIEEDKIFADFSASLGIASVREYEEKTLRAAREREAELLRLEQQRSKLNAQISFERRKDVPAAVRKLEASIAEDAKTIAAKSEKQAKAQKTSEGLRAEASKVEEDAKAAKDAQAATAAELKSLKKELRTAADSMSQARVKLTQLENDVEQQRAQRQRIFSRARLEEVDLPTLDADADVADAGAVVLHDEDAAAAAASSSSGASGKKGKRKRGSGGGGGGAAHSGAAFRAAELMASETFSPSGSQLVGTGTMDGEPMDDDDDDGGGERRPAGRGRGGGGGDPEEPMVRIDFASLGAEERQADSASIESELNAEVGEVGKKIESMAPNMKALTQYEEVQERLHAIESEFDTSRSTAKSISAQFNAVQNQRYARFMAGFKAISEAIDDIYKDLTQVEGVPLGGTAYLSLEDPTEPYLHGTKYTAMPAGKRFREMDQLSGGERTVAALALLFAMHKYRPSPFFVMDEIDAALDAVNVTRVAKYIRERAAEGTLQFVVISLKDNFYHAAHGLVGIYRDRRAEASACVTLDLEAIDKEGAGVEDDDEDDDDKVDEGAGVLVPA